MMKKLMLILGLATTLVLAACASKTACETSCNTCQKEVVHTDLKGEVSRK
jgi:hypothetical protein